VIEGNEFLDLRGDKLAIDPMTAAAAAGFLSDAKEIKPSSNATSGDAFSGRSPISGTFGDVIVKAGKDSILTVALVVAGAIVIASLAFKTKRK